MQAVGTNQQEARLSFKRENLATAQGLPLGLFPLCVFLPLW